MLPGLVDSGHSGSSIEWDPLATGLGAGDSDLAGRWRGDVHLRPRQVGATVTAALGAAGMPWECDTHVV